jgi:hypothetical protein
MITLIILLSILVIILGFTTFNLLKKNEKCEDIILSYEDFFTKLSITIDTTDKKIKEIDAKESFKSDDEIGFFFNTIKYLQNELNNFKINNES